MIYKLSKRELELLEAVADGKSYKHMGNERTVKGQFYILRSKLGAYNNAHALVIAFRQGLLRL